MKSVGTLVLALSSLFFAPASAQNLTEAEIDASPYWHERYHGLLSMAAYGDYATLCPQTFTAASLAASFPDSTEEPWTVLLEWGPTASGFSGFAAQIPEMDKVVMVFKGMYGWEHQLNSTPASIDAYNWGCTSTANASCTAHQGALTAYLEAKEATDDWAAVAEAVNATGHQWSVTGHGIGGAIAQIAALDLGWRGLCHWSHSHGAPRVFSPAVATLYNSLFGGEAGQRCVANDDIVPTLIPESTDYTFTLEGIHVYGTNATFGQNYDICAYSATDPNCIGGNSTVDHDFYYTPIGHCGESGFQVNNATLVSAFQASESSAYAATGTGTFNISTPASTMTTSTTSSAATSTAVSTVTSSASSGAGATQLGEGTSATAAATTQAGGAASGQHVSRTVALLFTVGCIAAFTF
ncbi:protein of lipase, class 3 family [Pseudohyphozyma bogoriensis]|nr:protein of lipase, class 3 family [Pseudohyphozyma bogoriensis]